MSPEELYIAHARRVILRAAMAEDAMRGIDVADTDGRAAPHAALVEKFLYMRGQSVRDAG